MRELPSMQDAWALHKKNAPTEAALDLVWTHSLIISDICEGLVRHKPTLSVDTDLVRAGCLLHDIGVYRLYDGDGNIKHDQYVRHGVLGYELLSKMGFEETLCRFASCHTGVGLTRDDIRQQNLPLPMADYIPRSVEERLVLYADKFHSKTDPPKFMSVKTYSDYVQRFGEDKVTKFDRLTEEFGEPDLSTLAVKYGHELI